MIYIVMTIISCVLMMGAMFFKVVNTENTYNTENYFLNISGKFLSVVLMLCSYFCLFIVGAVRYGVGIDYWTYSKYQIPHVLMGDKYVKVEFLYREIINWGFSLSDGMHYQYIFVLTQFIIIFFMALAIQKNSKSPSFSIFIFVTSTFYAFSLSGMRQAISIAIFLFATTFIEEKHPYKYVGLIIVASLFHKFALIYLILYLFKYIKMNLFYCTLAVPILTLASAPLRSLIIFLSNKLNFYSEYFGGTFDQGTFKLAQVVYILIISLFLIGIKLWISTDVWEENKFFLNLQALLTLFMGIVTIIPTPSRIIYAILPVHIILIPNLIKGIKNRNIRVLVLVILLLIYSVFFYFCIIKNNYYETLPYYRWN